MSPLILAYTRREVTVSNRVQARVGFKKQSKSVRRRFCRSGVIIVVIHARIPSRLQGQTNYRRGKGQEISGNASTVRDTSVLTSQPATKVIANISVPEFSDATVTRTL